MNASAPAVTPGWLRACALSHRDRTRLWGEKWPGKYDRFIAQKLAHAERLEREADALEGDPSRSWECLPIDDEHIVLKGYLLQTPELEAWRQSRPVTTKGHRPDMYVHWLIGFTLSASDGNPTYLTTAKIKLACFYLKVLGSFGYPLPEGFAESVEELTAEERRVLFG